MKLTDVLIDLCLVAFVIDCMLMCVVVLMQRSKQEGLGAAFGGGMMDSAFGPQTSQVLVKATVWFAVIFFALSLILARLYAHRASEQEKGSTAAQQLLAPVPAVAPAVPGTTPGTLPNVPSTGTVPTPAPATTPAPSATTPKPAATSPALPTKPIVP